MAALLEPLSKPRPNPASFSRWPDPQRGVFETLLLLDGRPVELDAHLARLKASLAALFPNRTPPNLHDVPGVSGPYGCITPGTSGLSARLGDAVSLRITVVPSGDGELEAHTRQRAAPSDAFSPQCGIKGPTGGVVLHNLPLAGGLGAHKWADRSLLEEAQSRLPASALPLIVDRDGTVLEASRANVFAVRDGALHTPPADGRILPGVTRARVMEIAAETGLEACEAELSRDDLLEADEVFLTGSVRGVERVEAIDGMPQRCQSEIGSRIAAELWRIWTRFG